MSTIEKLRKRRAYASRWRAANRERLRKYFRRYRHAHPELKAKQARYYREHKQEWTARRKTPKARAWARRYRKINRAILHRRWLAWRRRNPERALMIARRHQENRKPRKRLADREYRRQNPKAYRQSNARSKARKPELYRQIALRSALVRRSRKRAVLVECISIANIVARDRSMCHLCQRRVRRADRSLDHLIPLVRGGACAEWNLMLAHLRCNKSRGTKQILSRETKVAAMGYIATRTT